MLRHLIIGCGAAGLAALGAIRRRDARAPVVVVWDEPVPPYARMALHCYVAGRLAEQELFLRDGDLLEQGPTRGFPGRRVCQLDSTAHQVLLDDGTTLPYDRLLIATGAQPVMPPIPGLELDGVLLMWTHRDARAIVARAASARRAVVLGAGFVGLQAAEALAPGRQVTVVEMADHVLPRMLDPVGADVARHLLSRQGVRVLTGARAQGIAAAHGGGGKRRALPRDESGRIAVATTPPSRAGKGARGLGSPSNRAGSLVLTLAGGEELPADVVVVATGARPRLAFLDGTPIAAPGGVVVDEALRTSLPGVYAAGDVALVPDLLSGGRAAAGIWPAAVAQGEVAGANMAGGDERYPGNVPLNVVHVAGVTIAALGLAAAEGATAQTFGVPDSGTFRRFLWRDGRLLGCVSIGPARDLGLLRQLIADGVPLPDGQKQFAEDPWDCSAPLLATRLLPSR